MDVWTKEQTSTFISLLREHPCLYDILHPHYLNRMQKTNAFSLILDGMAHIRGNLSVMSLRKKLRTLRTQLSRERGKVLSSRRSGSGADEVYKPTLWCYDELAFLIHSNDNPETSSNFEIPSQGQIENAQCVEETGHEDRGHEAIAEDLCEVFVLQEPEEEILQSQENERTKRRKCAEELQQQASKIMKNMDTQRKDLEERERQQQTQDQQQQQTQDQRHNEIKSMLQKIIEDQKEWQKKQDEKTRLLLECQLELFRVLKQQQPREDYENQSRLQTEIVEALHEEETEWFG